MLLKTAFVTAFSAVSVASSALGNALNKILSDAKEGYDENTTADFANTVKIINGKFPNETVLTADEVLELAKDYLYVAVTTDVTDTISLITILNTSMTIQRATPTAKPSKKVKTARLK